MSNRIKTTDAAAQLRQIIEANAKAATPNNQIISIPESAQLDPFVGRAAAAVRAEGGPGTRVKVSQVVERAMADATEAWNRVNTRGPAFLSKAEVAALTAADPALGALTQKAYLQAKGGPNSDAVTAYFETFDFSRRPLADHLPGGARIDVRPGQAGRAQVPASILPVFDDYYRAEAADWASVSLQRARVGGQEIYALFTSTDGDDAYLELFSKDGQPLTSGRIFADQLLGWDEFFGRARLSLSLQQLNPIRVTEGYSEPADKLAAGQIPAEWPGDVAVQKGEIRHDGQRFLTLDLASDLTLTAEQQALTYAAMEILWERTLQYRVDPGSQEPLRLGSMHQGVLRVGEHTNPVDGKTYAVADWRDIDDASYTFYFERTPTGPKLAIEQFNN